MISKARLEEKMKGKRRQIDQLDLKKPHWWRDTEIILMLKYTDLISLCLGEQSLLKWKAVCSQWNQPFLDNLKQKQREKQSKKQKKFSMKSKLYLWKLDLSHLTFPNICSLTQASHLLLIWNQNEGTGTYRGQIITPVYPRMERTAI